MLSTRLFRDPDLGVMLLFKKVETGVDISTAKGVMTFSGRPALRDNGVVAGGGAEAATLGVNGLRLELFAAAVALRIGGREALLCLSCGGMLFL